MSDSERIEQLESALKKIKKILELDMSILVNVDIDNKQIGREVRLYTENGKSLGFGESVVSKLDSSDLFTKGYNTYKVSLKVKELF